MNSANMVIPKQLFNKLGGFNENVSRLEDREFCEKIRNAGVKMVFAPEILVYHAHPTTLHDFWGQHISWGKAAYNMRFRIGNPHMQPGFEPLAFYLNLVLRPFFDKPNPNTLMHSSLLAISQVATLCGFTQAWASKHLNSGNREQ